MSDDDIHAAFLDEMSERTPTVADGCDCGEDDCDICNDESDCLGVLDDYYDSDLE